MANTPTDPTKARFLIKHNGVYYAPTGLMVYDRSQATTPEHHAGIDKVEQAFADGAQGAEVRHINNLSAITGGFTFQS